MCECKYYIRTGDIGGTKNKIFTRIMSTENDDLISCDDLRTSVIIKYINWIKNIFFSFFMSSKSTIAFS